MTHEIEEVVKLSPEIQAAWDDAMQRKRFERTLGEGMKMDSRDWMRIAFNEAFTAGYQSALPKWIPIAEIPDEWKDGRPLVGFDPKRLPCSRYDIWRHFSKQNGLDFYVNSHDTNDEGEQPTHLMPVLFPPKVNES